MFSLTLSMSFQHATRLQSELLYRWLSTVQPTLLLAVFPCPTELALPQLSRALCQTGCFFPQFLFPRFPACRRSLFAHSSSHRSLPNTYIRPLNYILSSKRVCHSGHV